jgi:hypothetical protein
MGKFEQQRDKDAPLYLGGPAACSAGWLLAASIKPDTARQKFGTKRVQGLHKSVTDTI